MRWRIVTALLVVSLLPLGLMGVGAWLVFGHLFEERAVEHARSVVRSHAHSIESCLATQRDLLQLVAETGTLGRMTDPSILQPLLVALNNASDGAFVDLGVIGEDGRHLAYLGPYDLEDRNYIDAEWFREVMVRGVFISDVFLGFRRVPHFVIAVKKQEGDGARVLRATINSQKFDALVQTGTLGTSGEAYLVSREGLFQTAPRLGSVLDRAPLSSPTIHNGVRVQRLDVDGARKIRASSWINANRWLLVVQQDAAEMRAPVTRAVSVGALLTLISVMVVVITTFMATRHLSRQIDKANREREEIFGAFMRSAKLASVGELATGLAHEINNPLAIISAEQTNISDLVEETSANGPLQAEILESTERIRRQLHRCADITQKVLQFGRNRETGLELVDIAPRLHEIARLLHRRMSVSNVALQVDVNGDLPQVMVDPVELEQVTVNLVNNAVHAMPDGGRIDVRGRLANDEVLIEVEDNGEGMPQEIRERVFEPFFTTKSPGEGTGLGLSVCYGIVQSWGGRIEVDSEPGRGTNVRIHLPVRQAGGKP